MERLYDKIRGLQEQVHKINREILKISHDHIVSFLGVPCVISWVNDQDYDDNNYYTVQTGIALTYSIDDKQYKMVFNNYCDLDDTEAWFENDKVSEEFPDLEYDDTTPEWAEALTACYGKPFTIDQLAQLSNGASWLIDTAVSDCTDAQDYGP
jgi:hypothetical protein